MILKLLSSGDNAKKRLLQRSELARSRQARPSVLPCLPCLPRWPELPPNREEEPIWPTCWQSKTPACLDNISSLFSGERCCCFLKGLQYPRLAPRRAWRGTLGQIGSVLSRFTGVNEGAIDKLLGFARAARVGRDSGSNRRVGMPRALPVCSRAEGNPHPPPSGARQSAFLGRCPASAASLGDASSAATSAARTATTEVRGAAREAQAAGSSVMKWLIPLLLLVLAFFLLPKMCRKATETAPVVKEKAAEAIPAQDDGTKLISDATGLIKDATDSVASINDEASATQLSRN